MPPLWWIICVAVILFIIVSYFSRKGEEKKLFREMMENPCDEVVTDYIQAFRKSNGFISMVVMLERGYGAKQRDDKLRQAQGYEIISASPLVSASVKQELYNEFIAEGVPVKRK